MKEMNCDAEKHETKGTREMNRKTEGTCRDVPLMGHPGERMGTRNLSCETENTREMKGTREINWDLTRTMSDKTKLRDNYFFIIIQRQSTRRH